MIDISQYELIENNVHDVRFGNINIFMKHDDNEDLLMEIIKKSVSKEDHEFNCLQVQQRLALQHLSLLKMIGTINDHDNWIIKIYFEYPNEDLYDQRDELLNPSEIIKFMKHMLEVQIYLREVKFLHGDLRPEYIFYSHRKNRYILLDRLGDPTTNLQNQRNNLVYENKSIFMSPILFRSLSRNITQIQHNPYKSEVFSLGMVLLSMYTDEADLGFCYNKHFKIFDEKHFQLIQEDLETHFFVNEMEKIISSFLFNDILQIEEGKRMTPNKAYDKLINQICPRILVILNQIRNDLDLNFDRNNIQKPTENEEIDQFIQPDVDCKDLEKNNTDDDNGKESVEDIQKSCDLIQTKNNHNKSHSK